MSYTEIRSEEAYGQALKLARGVYQLDLLHGNAAWSGAGLKGKARSWGSAYARSRTRLLNRIKAAGIPHEFVHRAHNKLVLVIGETPVPTLWERLESS